MKRLVSSRFLAEIVIYAFYPLFYSLIELNRKTESMGRNDDFSELAQALVDKTMTKEEPLNLIHGAPQRILVE